jgi:hypothetical protein
MGTQGGHREAAAMGGGTGDARRGRGSRRRTSITEGEGLDLTTG